MTDLPLSLLAAAAAADAPSHLDPLKLFLDADIVVQAVMAGLILARLCEISPGASPTTSPPRWTWR